MYNNERCDGQGIPWEHVSFLLCSPQSVIALLRVHVDTLVMQHNNEMC
jgi:hypothetical protein